MEVDIQQVFRHIGGRGLEGRVKVVGVPKERGGQLVTIRIALECQERGEVQ